MINLRGIVAVAEDGTIGDKGGLPWHLPEDLKMFRDLTMGAAVIVGRKTWESIKNGLPGRFPLIVGRDYLTLEKALEEAKKYDRVYVIGGAQIYEALAEHISVWWVTVVDGCPDGDTKLTCVPSLEDHRWRTWRVEDGYRVMLVTRQP